MKNHLITLLENSANPIMGDPVHVNGSPFTLQASGSTASGRGDVTVYFYGSNHQNPSLPGDWIQLGSIVLSASVSGDSATFGVENPYMRVKAEIASIAGDNTKVSCFLCEVK